MRTSDLEKFDKGFLKRIVRDGFDKFQEVKPFLKCEKCSSEHVTNTLCRYEFGICYSFSRFDVSEYISIPISYCYNHVPNFGHFDATIHMTWLTDVGIRLIDDYLKCSELVNE